MKRQRAVLRNGPGCGGPDDGRNVRANLRSSARAATHHLESHPNGWAGVVLVLDLSLRERRVVVNAPVDRLAATIYVALLHEIQQSASNGGLILMAHGQVGVVPTAEHAQPLEV